MFDGIIAAINTFLIDVFTWIPVALLNLAYGASNGLMTVMTPLGGLKYKAWTELSVNTYNMVASLCQHVVVPAAMVFFILIMMVRLVGVAKVVEGNDTSQLAPRVGVILFQFVFGAILIQNSFAIITVGYDIMQHIIRGIFTYAPAGDMFNPSSTTSYDQVRAAIGDNMGNVMTACFAAVILLIASVVAVVVALFCYFSKVITMYIQAFLSPFGCMMLFGESTKSWGLAFIKWVASNFLAIVLVVLIFNLMPTFMDLVMNNTGISSPGSDYAAMLQNTISGSANGIMGLLGLIVVYLVIIFMMIGSSKLASSLFNG